MTQSWTVTATWLHGSTATWQADGGWSVGLGEVGLKDGDLTLDKMGGMQLQLLMEWSALSRAQASLLVVNQILMNGQHE